MASIRARAGFTTIRSPSGPDIPAMPAGSKEPPSTARELDRGLFPFAGTM